MSNQGLQTSKRPFDNLNRFANFERGIDSHNLFLTYPGPKPDHNIFRQRCQMIPKVNDSPDAVRSFNSAVLFRIDEFGEEIAGEHGFYEPDWPSLGHPSETQSRRETLDAKLTPERGRGQVLPFWLRLQTEPDRLSDQRERGG
jgi:hypothetical protein